MEETAKNMHTNSKASADQLSKLSVASDEMSQSVNEISQSIGAGDLWQAGFLFGWLHHAAPEVCGRIGSILGAAAVSNFGARLPEDRWRELREKIRTMI